MKKISLAIVAFFFLSVGQMFSQVQYTIRWETSPQPCYVVYMKSTTAYTLPFSQIPTAQVTVVAPHGTGASKFTVSNLVSYETSMQWVQNARVDAPIENPSMDYITFGFQGATSFNIAANTEIKLFSFKNSGTCLGTLQLIENLSDPFSNLTPPDYANSANTNPGNAITVLGAGGEAYSSNYGTGANACAPSPLVINSPAVQSATVNQPKSGNAATELAPTGGTAPYIYSNGSGDPACIAPAGSTALPTSSNLSINGSTGAYTYTAPSAAGTYYFCVKVCDSATPTPSCKVAVYQVVVSASPSPLVINTPTTQSATVNQPKSGNAATELAPTGGTAPYIYSNGSGDPACIAPAGATALPTSSNLSINGSTGAYTYTAPSTAGTYYFCVKVCDSATPTPSCKVAVYQVVVSASPCPSPNCSTVVTVVKN